MFQVPSNIESIRTLKDNTVRLTVDCQEIAPIEMAEVFTLKGRLGWFIFSENTIEQSDIPKENAPEFKNDKSPSKRLRDTLYVYWDKCTDKSIDFNSYWEKWTNKKVEEIKNKLP